MYKERAIKSSPCTATFNDLYYLSIFQERLRKSMETLVRVAGTLPEI
jgi:hypothetical protein